MAKNSKGGRTGFEGSPEIGGDRKSRNQVGREIREGRQAVEDTREERERQRAEREGRQDKRSSTAGQVVDFLGSAIGGAVAGPAGALVGGIGLSGLFDAIQGQDLSPPDRFREPSRDSDNNRTGRQLQAVSQAPAPAPAPVPVAPIPIIVPGDPANVGLRGRRRRRLLGADETGLFRTPTLLGRR